MTLTNINFPTVRIPELLYHYTSIEAFESILANQSVWLSDLAKMNDSMERRWVSKLFKEVWLDCLESMRAIIDADAYFYDFEIDKIPVFALCLSAAGDLLSQWRAYASDGQGVAIGFRPHSLGFPVKTRFIDEYMEDESMVMTKCMYNRRKQTTLMRDFIKYFESALAICRDGSSLHAYEGTMDTARWCLRKMSFVFKHPGFSEEREWRAIFQPLTVKSDFKRLGPERFRFREGQRIAYHECRLLGEETIGEIVIGPKSRLTEVDAKRLVLSQNFMVSSIRRSTIPYR